MVRGALIALMLTAVLLGGSSEAQDAAKSGDGAAHEIKDKYGITWKEGENYQLVSPAPASQPVGGKIQVLEFFQYGCPHCYILEPTMVEWNRIKPANVEFVRVPVTWRPELRSLARLYYTLQALGRIDNPGHQDLHHEVYDTIHRIGEQMVDKDDDARTLQAFVKFAGEFGIAADQFTQAYQSAAVDAKVKQADALYQAYHITGTPMMVVGGRYRTQVSMAGGEERMAVLLTDLARAAAAR